MADNSRIEWTDDTWNFVTGCVRVSPGCANCYMHPMYLRLRGMGRRGYETTPDSVQILPERLSPLYGPVGKRTARRIFVNSMSDTFARQVDFEAVTYAFTIMGYLKPHHTYQVLTKRPGRAVAWWERHGRDLFGDIWPPNVWLGTSVEDQKRAGRLTVLAQIPAPVRFASIEPLLEPVDVAPWLDRLGWVIVGGESGPKARPMEPEWAERIRDDCAAAGVPFFMKQMAKRAPIPPSLEIREFPGLRVAA